MARVRFSIDFEDGLQWRLVEPGHMGTGNIFSLTEEEHADFVEVLERYEEWQVKLGQLNPDGWVAPPPPKPRTPEETALYESQKEVNLSAFLDQHFPIK